MTKVYRSGDCERRSIIDCVLTSSDPTAASAASHGCVASPVELSRDSAGRLVVGLTVTVQQDALRASFKFSSVGGSPALLRELTVTAIDPFGRGDITPTALRALPFKDAAEHAAAATIDDFEDFAISLRWRPRGRGDTPDEGKDELSRCRATSRQIAVGEAGQPIVSVDVECVVSALRATFNFQSIASRDPIFRGLAVTVDDEPDLRITKARLGLLPFAEAVAAADTAFVGASFGKRMHRPGPGRRPLSHDEEDAVIAALYVCAPERRVYETLHQHTNLTRGSLRSRVARLRRSGLIEARPRRLTESGRELVERFSVAVCPET
jgi:hypothetical protein